MSMATGILVSEEEYLSTSYQPDCEFEDGALIERNVGTKDHSRLLIVLGSYIHKHEALWGVEGFGDARHKIRSGRYLLPDLCIMQSPSPDEQVFSSPPLVWIEILSPEDRPIRVNQKIRELLEFGVPNIWIIDPQTLEAEIHTPRGSRSVDDGVLRAEGTPIEVPLQELEER